jgi:hypothetical protein
MAIRESELARWAEQIKDAKRVAADDVLLGSDVGTCVLGAGVALDVIPKGGRIARRRIVIDAPFQGNVGSRLACENALALLVDAGLDAYWYDGIMD